MEHRKWPTQDHDYVFIVHTLLHKQFHRLQLTISHNLQVTHLYKAPIRIFIYMYNAGATIYVQITIDDTTAQGRRYKLRRLLLEDAYICLEAHINFKRLQHILIVYMAELGSIHFVIGSIPFGIDQFNSATILDFEWKLELKDFKRG